MDFRILGPLQVADGTREIPMPRRKQRALLAALLLDAGRPVSVDRLIDGLWGEQPPATAREALQNYISQLRKTLGGEVVVTEPAGYAIRIAPEQLDLARFERLSAEAREHEAPAERADRLREALGLWRGRALDGLLDEPFAQLEAGRLEELHLAARQDLTDAELALGGGSELVGEIETLVAEHPFDERLRAQLMLALYRAGRQADALEAYRAARAMLVDELGIEPGAQLRELEQAILRQDEALAIAGAGRAVRKTVTVLTASVGAAELDPEAARRLLDECAAALRRHGATTERFAGDSVTAVFGVPTAREDDALRAVRTAVDLRRVLSEARCGIASGEVLVDEQFVTGGPLALARRLELVAGPSEILLAASTLRLVRDAVTVKKAPPLAGAAPAFRLDGLVAGAPAITRRLDSKLVGRRVELARLQEAFGQAQDGCVAAVVLGDAGIGKTRLANELAAWAGDRARVLVGRCASYGEGATFRPLVELLGDVPQAESSAELFLEVRRRLAALAAERPLMLVLDDVHWAEPTLLDLVDYLVAQRAGLPVLVVCLARPDLAERRPGWADGAIVLEPLAEPDCEVLLDALPGGSKLEPDLRRRVLEVAEGNPLYVEQLLAAVAEGETDVPPSIEALLASRLDRLAADDRATIEHAAVVGREFSARALLELAAGEGEASLRERLVGLAGRGLVEPDREDWAFRHVLIRDVAYRGIPKAVRAELHERLGDRLGETGEADELVGYHLEQAYRYCVELGPADRRALRLAEDAGTRLGAAGIRAWKRGDAPATINLLGRATALLPDDSHLRAELVPEYGLALATAGQVDEAEHVLQQAADAASGDRRMELRARLELARVRLFSGSEDAPARFLELAGVAIPVFEATEDQRALGRAWRVLGLVQGALRCQNVDWQAAAERALLHYRRSGWPAGTCRGEIAAALYYGPTPVAAALTRCEELLEETSIGGRATVLLFVGGLEAMHGEFDSARSRAALARSIYQELGQPAVAARNCGTIEAGIELLAGETEAARELLETSYEELLQFGDRAYLPTRAAELASVLYRQGRNEEATQWADRAAELAIADDLPTQFLWRAVAAKIEARRGQAERAQALADEAVRLADQTDSLSQRASVWLDRAEVLAELGRPDDAAAGIGTALDLLEAKGNVAAATSARALLGDLVSTGTTESPGGTGALEDHT